MIEYRERAARQSHRLGGALVALLLVALGLGAAMTTAPTDASPARVLRQGGVTLSVSPPSVGPGGIVTATWSGITNPTSDDWIALYPAGAADEQYLVYRFTTGTSSGNVPFQLPSTLAPGTYELRLFSNSTWLRLAVSNAFTLPSLSVAPTSIQAGGVVTATWSGISNPSTIDWIALYPAGAADEQYLVYRFTTGTTSGNVPFQLPSTLTPGTYELRLFSNSTWLRLAVSNSFTVLTLTVSPPSLAPGGILTAAWAGIPSPTPSDWLGLYPAGAADTDLRYSFEYTDGSASGQIGYQLPSDLPVGTYELRLFSNGSWQRLAASNAFTSPTLTVNTSVVHSGDTVTVSWNGIANPTTTDWIGLFPTGSVEPYTLPLTWQYTDGSANNATGYSIPPAAVGTYELRLFSSGSWLRLAISNTVTVPAPTPTPLPGTGGDPDPNCIPRPPVRVSLASGTGSVTVSVPDPDTLHALTFGQATNARIDAGGFIGSTGGFSLSVPSASSTGFHISAINASANSTNPGAVLVPFVVTDNCGDWPTFVGSGSASPVPVSSSTPVPTNTATATPIPTAPPLSSPTASLSFQPAAVGPGTPITAFWSNVPNPTAGDYVLSLSQDKSIPYSTVVVTPSASGHVAVPVGSSRTPGPYYLRYQHANGGWYVDSTSTYSVVRGSATPTPTQVPTSIPAVTLENYAIIITSLVPTHLLAGERIGSPVGIATGGPLAACSVVSRSAPRLRAVSRTVVTI
ncbi:MAG TPA: hypothetical protein VII06_10280, partial [Chloroflexota bacterium]